MPAIQLTSGTHYYTDRPVNDSPFPPIVLIHGAGGSHLDWSPQMRRLPAMRVICVDLPGHGRSAGPARSEVRAYASDVLAVLDQLNVPRAIIAGHSMGGAIAQQLALRAPARVAGLVLLGTGSKLPVDPTLPQRALEDPYTTSKWIVEWAWHPTTPTPMKELALTRLLETAPETLRADFLACQSFDSRADVATIVAPVLVMAAEDDRMVKVAFSRTLAETIPHATLSTLATAGHMFPLEQPQVVADRIVAWIKEQTW